jgi:excisionase family DNA binding protein
MLSEEKKIRYTVRDAAKLSGLSTKTVQRMANKGKIPFQRDYNGWRIFTKEAIELLQKMAGVAEPDKQ